MYLYVCICTCESNSTLLKLKKKCSISLKDIQKYIQPKLMALFPWDEQHKNSKNLTLYLILLYPLLKKSQDLVVQCTDICHIILCIFSNFLRNIHCIYMLCVFSSYSLCDVT